MATRFDETDRAAGHAPACAFPGELKPILGAHIALDDVSPLERVMLACDGTFTFQLEAYVREKIRIEILDYRESDLPAAAAPILARPAGTSIWERKVLLRGAGSDTPFIFAHSFIDAEHLPEAMQDDLRQSPDGIGRLFVDYKLSIYRDLVGYCFEDGAVYQHLFPSRAGLQFLTRAYRIHFEGRPVMMILEKMPRGLFA